MIHFRLCLQLEKDDFQEAILGLGFSEEQESLLSKLCAVKKQELTEALSNFGLKLPQYHDMNWRFEVQVPYKLLKYYCHIESFQ